MSSSSPFLGLLVPAYDSPSTLSRLLHSCFEQTFQDFHIYISDDSSNDSVFSVVNGFPNNRITYWRNSSRLGVPANWNLLLKSSDATYIKLMHHDEYFSSIHSLQTLYSSLLATGASILVSNHQIVDQFGHVICPSVLDGKAFLNYITHPLDLFFNNRIGSPSNITLLNTLSIAFRYSDIRWFVDVLYYNQLLQTCEAYFLPVPIVCSLANSPQQVSRHFDRAYYSQYLELISALSVLRPKTFFTMYQFSMFLKNFLLRDGRVLSDAHLVYPHINLAQRTIVSLLRRLYFLFRLQSLVRRC